MGLVDFQDFQEVPEAPETQGSSGSLGTCWPCCADRPCWTCNARVTFFALCSPT